MSWVGKFDLAGLIDAIPLTRMLPTPVTSAVAVAAAASVQKIPIEATNL
jgi:hypothetical protein